jgi:hypothetical protein
MKLISGGLKYDLQISYLCPENPFIQERACFAASSISFVLRPMGALHMTQCKNLSVTSVPENQTCVYFCSHPKMEKYRPGKDYDLITLYCRPGKCKDFKEVLG